jgi:hypothetical protein
LQCAQSAPETGASNQVDTALAAEPLAKDGAARICTITLCDLADCAKNIGWKTGKNEFL